MKADVEHALAAFKGGDVERGLKLLERTVMSFGMKVCGHREDAEDTTQEVLLKLLPYISQFDNPKAFGVWLYTVARNRCIMSRRRSKFAPQQHLRLDDLMPDGQELAALATAPDASPEASLLRAEHSEEVRSALGAIPAQYRLILVLHDMEGLGTSEISSIMKLREGTVRVRLHRARLALRKELSARSRPTSHSDTRVPRTAKPRRCREIFAALSDYLDETLEPGMCEQLERHMAGCQPCHAFLADLERTVDRCRSFDPSCDSKSQSKMRKQVLEEYRRVLSALKKSAANPA